MKLGPSKINQKKTYIVNMASSNLNSSDPEVRGIFDKHFLIGVTGALSTSLRRNIRVGA